jgi:hypothetical protein
MRSKAPPPKRVAGIGIRLTDKKHIKINWLLRNQWAFQGVFGEG